MEFYGWRPYVPVAQRRRQAEREAAQLRKQGQGLSPVSIAGTKIAKTFWGKAWCDNLERYSDFANRLPRGRTYVRNGSVIDLQITSGAIRALVSGSELYEVVLAVTPVPETRWKAICAGCAGAIDSLVELLQGRLSQGVMERICQPGRGLFPAPDEITLSCSCPDWAGMCKHVAAVLYGVGARLDHQPELLFRLRTVDEKELIVNAGQAISLAQPAPAGSKVLGGEDLSDLFGLDMAQSASPALEPPAGKPERPKKTVPAKKVAAKKVAAKKTVAAKKAAATKKGRKAKPAALKPRAKGAPGKP